MSNTTGPSIRTSVWPSKIQVPADAEIQRVLPRGRGGSVLHAKRMPETLESKFRRGVHAGIAIVSIEVLESFNQVNALSVAASDSFGHPARASRSARRLDVIGSKR